MEALDIKTMLHPSDATEIYLTIHLESYRGPSLS